MPAPAGPLAARLFAQLADGRFHSGEALAKRLQVTRSAIWKAATSLRTLGVPLQAVRNRGYRLERPATPLDAAGIREHLPPGLRAQVGKLETVWSTGSTNSVLLARPGPASGVSEVLLAEYQSAGRGRRGRTWLAPPGGAICLSLSWTFREVPPDLGALGLVIGVCALRALRAQGLKSAALKWPNDLLVGERKLAGILIDLRAEGAGPAHVVIGIGLNVALGGPLLAKIARAGTPATDLTSAGLEKPPRNEIAASLIGECLRGLGEFERHGLRAFAAEWHSADALRGRAVDVRATEGSSERGLARGIDVHGALMVETPQGVRRFISGEVTVRAAG
ncbi:MAG TPA: biotin--[acetyl-CoA-carboxylase] ligase [Steroidobacteraceae bacterium]|nr:biotin--[acetyl-CoA-carboxylase] ligase [Steroidobacteraceae bacterium]